MSVKDNWSTKVLTLIDSWTDSTNSYKYVSVDSTNKRVLLSSDTNLAILSYT